MKNLVSMGCVLALLMTVLFIVMGAKSLKTYQHIETDLYQVSVPKDWTVIRIMGSTLTFQQDGDELGGIDIRGYYPDQPRSSLYPNHSETVYENKLEGFFTDTLEVMFILTPPAASGEHWEKEQLHIYFLMKDEKIAYDLYFNSEYVDDETALRVAKSFQLKKQPIDS